MSLFSIGGLVATKGMFLPFWDVIGHHTYAPHVGSYLPAVGCMDGKRVKTEKKHLLEMHKHDNRLELIQSQRAYERQR